MAFVLVENWSGRHGVTVEQPPLFLQPFPFQRVLGNERDLRLWRLASVALVILLHIAMAWLFINHAAGTARTGEGENNGVTVIDLIVIKPKPNDEFEVPNPDLSLGTPPPLSSLEVSAASYVFKPEWTMSRFTPNIDAPSSTQPSASLGAVTNAGAGTGTGGYDPYAGASPQRREETRSGSATSQSSGIAGRLLTMFGMGSAPSDTPYAIEQEALDAATRAARAKLPKLRGKVELSARVSPTGMILDIEEKGGDLSDANFAILRSAFIGRRLFSVQTAQNDALWVRLPVIDLGG